jgi:glucose dehydrogenase
MARFHRIAAIAALIAALGVSVSMYAQQGRVANTASNAAANVTNEVLRRTGAAADPFAGAWLSYGRTQGETRYSPLKQIDTTNAKRLGLAWSYVMGAGGGNQEGTPLMWNNTLYGITTWSVVFALDARTGKELWRWDPEVNQTTVRPMICCGIVNRGIALYNGMIIAPSIDGRLFGLNALTGKPVGNSRGVPAGSVHIDHVAAHGRQGDHRRVRRRQAHARTVRCRGCADRSTCVALLHGAGRSIKAV